MRNKICFFLVILMVSSSGFAQGLDIKRSSTAVKSGAVQQEVSRGNSKSPNSSILQPSKQGLPQEFSQSTGLPKDSSGYPQFMASLLSAQKKSAEARDVAYQLHEEFNRLYDLKVREISDDIVRRVFKKDGKISPQILAKTKPVVPEQESGIIGLFDRVKKFLNPPKEPSRKAAEAKAVDEIQTPFGPIKMSEKLKELIAKNRAVEAEIDTKLKSMLSQSNALSDRDIARILILKLDSRFRNSVGMMHSEVYGLRGANECSGDIVRDGLVAKYMDGFLAGRYADALENLNKLFNQMTCISIRQGKQLDFYLKDAYETAMSYYGKVVSRSAYSSGVKDNIDAAIYNLALVTYDINKSTFSVWQDWFCKNGASIVKQYKPGLPLHEFGIWLYDSENAAIYSVNFKTDDDSKFSCLFPVSKAVENEFHSLYGASLEALNAQCMMAIELGSQIQPKKPGDVSFAQFSSAISDPMTIGRGILSFGDTAAVGITDTTGLCGERGGGGAGGGGSVTCQSAGGGGITYSCGVAMGSWPVKPGGNLMEGMEGFKAPVIVDVKKVRQAALCGSLIGDDSSDDLADVSDDFAKLMEYFKKMEEWKELNEESRLETSKERAIDLLFDMFDSIVAEYNGIRATYGIASLETGTKNVMLYSAVAAILGAQMYYNEAMPSGAPVQDGDSVVNAFYVGGNIYVTPYGADPWDYDNTAKTLVHEAIHAMIAAELNYYISGGAVDAASALGGLSGFSSYVGINSEIEYENSKGEKYKGSLDHGITGSVGLGYSTYVPSPISLNSSLCPMMAAGSFLSPQNCKVADGVLDQPAFCSRPDVDCGNPLVSAMASAMSSSSGGGAAPSGGFDKLSPPVVDPMPGDHYDDVSSGPCSVGLGGPIVDVLKVTGGGIIDPSPIEKLGGFSNWIIDKAFTGSESTPKH